MRISFCLLGWVARPESSKGVLSTTDVVQVGGTSTRPSNTQGVPPYLRLCCISLAVLLLPMVPRVTSAAETVRPREAFSPGYQLHVSSRVELSGSLPIPPDKDQRTPQRLPVSGESAIEYDERVLPVAANEVTRTARIYRRL